MMRKQLFFIPAMLLACAVQGWCEYIEKEVAFNRNDLSFAKEQGYDVIRLKGGSPIYELGHPQIPAVNLTYSIPSGAEVKSVEILAADEEALPGEINLFPVQQARPLSMKGDFPFVEPDIKIYSLTMPYPEKTATLGHIGDKGGFRLVTVTFCPVRYVPAQKKAYFCSKIRVRINYEQGKLSVKAMREGKWKEFAGEVKKLVQNPKDVEIFAPPVKTLFTGSKALAAGTVEHVIICEDSYASTYQPLADWKSRKGVPSRVVPLSYIYANYAGADNPDRIRNFIKDADAVWGAKWFLLGGGHDDAPTPLTVVPRRDAWCVDVPLNAYADEDTIGADLYYADLDGDWNGDGDGVYGETGDGVNMYSDVYVGRAPVKNTTEAARFVNMVLTYEKTPPAGYLPKMLLTSMNLFTGYDGSQVSDSIAKYNPSGFIDSKCYDELDLYDNLASIDSMNIGYGYAHYAGHGNILQVMAGTTNPITSANLDAYLATGSKMGFHYGICCLPGAFDYDCYAKHLLLNPAGGCFCMLNDRFGFGTLDNGGHSEWLDIWFTTAFVYGGYKHFGDAQARMKDRGVPWTVSDVVARWCIYEYNLFADPETPFWTSSPSNFMVAHNAVVSGPIANNFTVTVKGSDGVTPVDSALVCLCCKQDTLMYVRGYTDIAGNVTLPVNPAIHGDTMWVTATKQNYYPYQGQAIVNHGSPSKSALYKLLDFGRDWTATPTLAFSSVDYQGDNVEYRVYWDTLPGFATADSAVTGLYASGNSGSFTFLSPLVNGKTYWWKVKGRDPGGSGAWGPISDVRNFSIETSLPSHTCSWFQTKGTQFNFNAISGAAQIQGDSVVLAPSAAGRDTLIKENFDAGTSLPAGWTTHETANNTYDWGVGTGATNPPNFGTYYARIIYSIISPAPPVDNDDIIAPTKGIKPGTNVLYLKYGWGMNFGVGESLTTWVRFKNAGVWGLWLRVGTAKKADGSGTDSLNLVGYLPQDSLQVKWRFSNTQLVIVDRSGAIDNVFLVDAYNLSNASGTMTGVPVLFSDLNLSYPRTDWGYVKWNKTLAADSIGMQVEHCDNGSWALVPDAALPGNAAGFFSPNQACSLDIRGLNPAVYDTLRLKANLYRPTVKASVNPSLQSWELGKLSASPSGVELTEVSAVSINAEIVIRWRTESEAGNAYWIIEKTANYRNENTAWVEIATVSGQGTKPTATDYLYSDKDVSTGQTYYYRLTEVDFVGNSAIRGIVSVTYGGSIPPAFALHPAYPNPFHDAATICCDIPKRSVVCLKAYNIQGQLVKTLVNEIRNAGAYKIRWNGTDNNGKSVAAGIYFYKLTVDGFNDMKKVMLIK